VTSSFKGKTSWYNGEGFFVEADAIYAQDVAAYQSPAVIYADTRSPAQIQRAVDASYWKAEAETGRATTEAAEAAQIIYEADGSTLWAALKTYRRRGPFILKALGGAGPSAGPLIEEEFLSANTPVHGQTTIATTRVISSWQVELNRAKGDEWEWYIQDNVLPMTQTNIQRQITVRSSGPSSLKVRLDTIGIDRTTGAVRLTDMKASSTAPLSPNQTVVYPELKLYGGVVVGRGKGSFAGGVMIPPTTVDIVRKN